MGSRGGTCHTGVALHPARPPPCTASAIAPFKGSVAPGKSALQIVSILCSPWFCLCLCLVDRVTLQLVKICLLSHPLPLLPPKISDFCVAGTGECSHTAKVSVPDPPAGLRRRPHPPDDELLQRTRPCKVKGRSRHPKAACS